MAEQYQNRRPKNILDDFKYRLSADKVEGGDKRPLLAFSIVGNNPRIDVYTNVPTDTNRGIIRAAMDVPIFFALLDRFSDIIHGGNDRKHYIENLQKNRETNKLEVVSKTIVGKDKEGIVYMSVISSDAARPKIKFAFKPSYFHRLIDGDTGKQMGIPEASMVMAKAFHRILSELVPNVLNSQYKEPEPRAQRPGQSRPQQEYRKPTPPPEKSKEDFSPTDGFDDDIPF